MQGLLAAAVNVGPARAALVLLALLTAPSAALVAQAPLLYPGPRPFTDCTDTWRVAVADLNLDGHADVVTGRNGGAANGQEPGFAVLLGHGDGTFSPPTVVPGVKDTLFALGDVNGDGVPDLVTFDHAGSGAPVSPASLRTHLGNGDGAFGPAIDTLVSIPSGFGSGLALGDFTEDGLVDAVESVLGVIRIAISVGDGTFAPVTTIGGAAGELLAIDVNGDGHLDVVAGYNLQVWRGDGGGNFQAPIINAPGPGLFQFSKLASADLDGDGHLDLVAQLLQGPTQIWRGAGDGTFTKVKTLSNSLDSTDPQAADLDGDGLPEIIAGQRKQTFAPPNPGGLLVRRNLGGLKFAPPVLYRTGGTSQSLALLDANEDGHADVATGQLLSCCVQPPGDIGLSFGIGDGSFAQAHVTPLSCEPLRVALADLDSDGNPDLIALLAAGLSAAVVALGDGAGGFGAPVDVDLGAARDAARDRLLVADLNGDGRPDLAAAAPDASGPLLVAFGAGGTAFGVPQVIGAGGVAALRGADLDLDGDLDLVVVRTDQKAAGVLLNLGAGSFAAEVAWPTAVSLTDVRVADVTGDGIPDLAAAGFKIIIFAPDGRLVLWEGVGDGSFLPPLVLTHPAVPRVIAAADVNRDGFVDLLTSDLDGSLRVLHGSADGSLSEPDAMFVGTVANTLVTADVNRDGLVDVVAAATTPDVPTTEQDDQGAPGQVVLLLGAVGGGFMPALHSFTGGSPHDLAVADLDADGFPDLVAPARTDDEVWVLLNPSPTWASLGLALPASFGTPVLTGSGTPAPDLQVTLLATGVLAPSFGLLFLGLDSAFMPFFGGVLVPAPTVSLRIRPNFPIEDRWPKGVPPGTPFYAQAWFATPPLAPGVSSEISATNALVTIAQ